MPIFNPMMEVVALLAYLAKIKAATPVDAAKTVYVESQRPIAAMGHIPSSAIESFHLRSAYV
jgi:hypothetical protein